MADFTPINTQEEFDQKIQERLARERATIAKRYEDYDQIKKDRDDFSSQIEGFQKTAKENADKITDLETKLADANKKAADFELKNFRSQAALANGIPKELCDRITGDTEEAINEDAKKLAGLFKKQNNKGLPPFEAGGDGDDDFAKNGKVNKDRAMKKFEKSLNFINE